jgi:hypothetical protein
MSARLFPMLSAADLAASVNLYAALGGIEAYRFPGLRHAALRANPSTVVTPPQDTPWGERIASIEDGDENLIMPAMIGQGTGNPPA